MEMMATLARAKAIHKQMIAKTAELEQRWSRLSEQIFRIDKWSLCRGQAAKRSGSGVK
jgi:hypothetical protein